MELSQEERKPVIQSQDIMTVRETPEGTGSVNRERLLPQLKKTHGADFVSLACLSSKISSHSRNREEDSQQLNSIKNYFQTTVKKRYINSFSQNGVLRAKKFSFLIFIFMLVNLVPKILKGAVI